MSTILYISSTTQATSMPRRDAGERRSQAIPRKRSAEATIKPIYGNFQRYYHIRNPPNSTDPDASAPSISTHPALAVDTRVTSILKYLRGYYAGTYATAARQNTAAEDATVLDIGCNSGKLTIELAQTLPRLLRGCRHSSRKDKGSDYGPEGEAQLRILGVDIDPTLIKQAKHAAAAARSRYRPNYIQTAVSKSTDDGCSSEQDGLPADARHFPSVFPSLYGCISSLTDRDVEVHHAKRRRSDSTRSAIEIGATGGDEHRTNDLQLCPPYLDFIALDWVAPDPGPPQNTSDHSILNAHSTGGFDIILALSITKWIHIHHGDLGLIRFFARIAASLKPDGLLFLERQEWPSYHWVNRLDSSMKAKVKKLKLRPGGDFDWWLEMCGVELVEVIKQGTGNGFCRPLQVFRKMSGKEEGRGKELVDGILKGDEVREVPWVARSGSSSSSSRHSGG